MEPNSPLATILVVEDNPITQKMVRIALTDAGYEVLIAENGRAALAHLTTRRPDLVLMDLVLPDISGDELVVQMRKVPNGSGVPVIACTGFVSRSDEARYSGVDFIGFLIKPFEVSQLLQAVRKYLSHQDIKHQSVTPRRILLVDDDPMQQKALRLMLERAGHAVRCADSGPDAIEMVHAERPDMVLTDVLMPHMDGFTLCRELRIDPLIDHLPVVLISGNYLTQEDERLALRCGASAYLTRDDSFEQLLLVIERAITHPAPAPLASPGEMQGEHVSRMMHQLERQATLNRAAMQRSAVQGALLQQVSAISETLSRNRDASINLASILTPCLDSAGLSRGLLYLIDRDGRPRLDAQVGCDRILASAQALFGAPQLFERLAAYREPIALAATAPADSEGQRLLHEAQAAAALLFPVVSRERYFGAFVLLSASRDISRDDWLAFGRVLASQIGVTLTLSQTFSDLAHSEQRNRMIFERAHDAIFLTDDNLQIIDANPACVALTGYSLEQLRSMNLSDLADEYLRAKLPMLLGSYRSQGSLSGMFGFVHLDGSERVVRIAGNRISPTLYANLCQDITHQKRQEEAIRRLAYTDPLTDLPNRTALQTRLAELLQQQREQGQKLAVIVIDLANFRQINGTLGHNNGDLALNLVAQRLQTNARDAYLARIGGDEFAVLIRESAATKGFEAELERLLHGLSGDFIIDQVSVAIEAVAGMTVFPVHSSEATQLLRYAHVAVRAAHTARRPWLIYDPGLDQFRPENLAVLSEMRQALLSRDELILHYQPQLHLASGRIIGAEALVRWRHPTRGLLAPGAFLPVIEHTRMINDLAKWVLDVVMDQARAWEKIGLPLSIAFNLTAQDLDHSLVKRLEQALLTSGLPPQRLIVELSEGSLMETVGDTLSTLQSIRDMGIRLALDDFGAGYSALAYLGRLPLDTIKLDRSFAMAFPDRSAQAIVRASIMLAHDLGLTVTAEGVESKEVMETLRNWGCDEAQGYHLTRALPPEDLAEWLAKSPWTCGSSETA